MSSSGGKHVSFRLFAIYLLCVVIAAASPKQFALLLFELRVIEDNDEDDDIGDVGGKLKSAVSSGSSLRTTRNKKTTNILVFWTKRKTFFE